MAMNLTTKNTRYVGVAASFSVAPLEPLLAFWLQQLWSDCELELAPYGQVLEQLQVSRRALNQLRDKEVLGADVVLLRPEDLLRSRDGVVRADSPSLARARTHVREIAQVISATERHAGALLIGVVAASPYSLEKPELAAFDTWTRARIAAAVKHTPAAHLLKLDDAAALYDIHDVHDQFRDELAHIPFTDEYLMALATITARSLRALWEPPRKVIVLDCDNTLWGGACGEEPIEALEANGPYVLLRRFMYEQVCAGRLLCLASRNRETDVLEAFARCASPLKLEHIAAHRISGGRKSDAMLSLADELGFSPSEFIFVDDDPVECAEVRTTLPSVVVVELPGEAAHILRALNHVWEFDLLSVTDEDCRRGAFYRLEARRHRERDAAASLGEFVEGLRVRLEVHSLNRDNLARATQILARTNQFNLTGARCSEGELLSLAARGDTDVLVIRVHDRLGDYGLVGVLALRLVPPRAHLALLALSCRVLRRGVESRVLREVVRRAHAGGCTEISIAFRTSERNAPAREFLERLLQTESHEDTVVGGHCYGVALNDLQARLTQLDTV